MPKYVIERDVPGAGQMTPDELQGVSQKSVQALESLAGRAQWLESYITDNKIFCVFVAVDENAVREHAMVGGFPCDAVQRVAAVVDASTAESR